VTGAKDFREHLGEEIATTLKQVGLDTAAQHPLQFYFYFPTQKAARALAARLTPDGFTCEVDHSAAGGRWLCFASRTLPIDRAALTTLGKQFLEAAQQLGGEFDGWDRDTAVAGEPRSKTLLRHGYQLYQRGAYLRAAELLHKAVTIGDGLAASAATLLGLACFNLGEYAASVTAFERAVELNPADFGALSGLATALTRLQQYDRAVDVYQRSIKAKPEFAETHLNLACTYALMGKQQQALDTLKRAVALDPRMKDRALKAGELAALRGNGEFEALVSS
jgi:tetratricopeptide (TPR) repeat protein